MISHRNLRRGLAAAARTLAFGVAVLAAAAPAFAAGRILDVRIGRHDEFTRIVFELDGQAPHQVKQKAGATELVIELGAGSPAREILSNSDLVQSVRLEPKGGETTARVVLRTSRVRVSELTLESPSRLVIDVRPGEPVPLPAAAPAPKPAPPVVAKPAPAVPAPTPAPAAPPTASRPAPASGASPMGADVDEDELEDLAETEILVQADTEAAADDAADAEADAAAAAAAAATATARPARPGSPPSPAPSAATRPAPAPAMPPTTTSETPRGIADRLPDGINPLLLAGAVALLLGFLLWGILGRRDRTAREVESADETPANVFADRSATGWAEPAADTGAETSGAASTIEVPRAGEDTEEPAPESDLPLFTPRGAEPDAIDAVHEAEAVEAVEEDDMPAPLERGAVPRHLSVVPPESAAAPFAATEPPAAPPAGASFDVGVRVGDLERRIALLERKLEDAADVRERLERQVVAQTEELRVQRAAIARTQRVLRTLARPDDLPIEPAPRGSGPSGSGG